MVKNAIAYIVVYFLIVNIIVVFDIERISVNHFHTAKVGVFLLARKFFSNFLIEIWRQGRECATG